MPETPTELFVRRCFERKGFKVLRGGAPDYIFYKEGNGKLEDILFVEVKQKERELKPNQKRYLEILKELGASVRLIVMKSESLLSEKFELKELKEEEFKKFPLWCVVKDGGDLLRIPVKEGIPEIEAQFGKIHWLECWEGEY